MLGWAKYFNEWEVLLQKSDVFRNGSIVIIQLQYLWVIITLYIIINHISDVNDLVEPIMLSHTFEYITAHTSNQIPNCALCIYFSHCYENAIQIMEAVAKKIILCNMLSIIDKWFHQADLRCYKNTRKHIIIFIFYMQVSFDSESEKKEEQLYAMTQYQTNQICAWMYVTCYHKLYYIYILFTIQYYIIYLYIQSDIIGKW